jgi:hypothetical protein
MFIILAIDTDQHIQKKDSNSLAMGFFSESLAIHNNVFGDLLTAVEAVT